MFAFDGSLFAGLVLYPISIISKKIEAKVIPLVLFLAFIVILLNGKYIGIYGLLFLLVYSGAVFFYQLKKNILFFLCILASIACAKFHILPIHNYVCFEQVKKCIDCAPYSLWMNFDIALVTFPLWYLLEDPLRKIYYMPNIFRFFILNIIMVGAVLALSLLFKFVHITIIPFSFIKVLPYWFIINLFYTCFCEEFFFRGLIQRYLIGIFDHEIAGICLTALIFALFHFPGGIAYMILTFVAGMFYGYIYDHFGKIIYPIMSHFFLNLTHFLLFSYPYAV